MKAKYIARFLVVAAIVTLVCWWSSGPTSAVNQRAAVAKVSMRGIVTDNRLRPLKGATVYFIDTSMIDTSTSITPAKVLAGTVEGIDEPLEDIVNDPVRSKLLPKAVTDAKGKFVVPALHATATYFPFTVPATEDIDHLPGGDASRVSFSPKKTRNLAIHMSWKPPADAHYIGTSACYVCHGPGGSAEDVTSNKRHGHALMFHKPGKDTLNQDSESHAGSAWNELANKFTLATAYNKPVTGTTVKTLYFQDFNSSSATNNGNTFVIYEDTAGTTPVYVKAYLWKTADGQFNITLENVITPTDPLNFMNLKVPLTMGGYLRQRILVNGLPGLKGVYKLISYQAITGSASQGRISSYDRSRKPFTEGGGGGGSFTDFFNTTTKLLKYPTPLTLATPTGTSSMSCASCHVGFGGYEVSYDPTTGEKLAHTVADINGPWDLGGDGIPQDMGVKCEECHGPGSRHREEALKGVRSAPKVVKGVKSVAEDFSAKYIVYPGNLGADRASLICGRCHDPRGVLKSEEEDFPPVGISRAEYLKDYVNPAQKGLPAGNLWPDGLHSKGGHHGFTYENWLASKHARNTRRMVACDDCHDSMGDSNFRYALKGDPDDSTHGLCNQCHDQKVADHVVEKTGSLMTSSNMRCTTCHMTRTGKGGAGRPGFLLAAPTGTGPVGTTPNDAGIEYWENDQASHVFDVPKKFTPGVAGTLPGNAMPVPYTNACGTCHQPQALQYQQPSLLRGIHP